MSQVPDSYRKQIAKDFCTAFAPNRMGVTFRTPQNYVKGDEVGELWLLLAEFAIQAMNESQSNWFKKKESDL